MKTVLIGLGNLGSQLAKKIEKTRGWHLKQIISNGSYFSRKLARELEVPFTKNLHKIDQEADLYLLAIPDDQIEPLTKEMSLHLNSSCLLAHTSGNTSMNQINSYFSNRSIFYPLQTFSKSRIPDWKQIPICVEANQIASEKKLLALAKKLSHKVYRLSETERKTAHLAAVVSMNFSNYLIETARTILEQDGIDKNLIAPLLEEMMQKLNDPEVKSTQTGPAMRGDDKTMKAHIKMLKQHPALQKIYRDISKAIYLKYNS